jgi:hypothetical protein
VIDAAKKLAEESLKHFEQHELTFGFKKLRACIAVLPSAGAAPGDAPIDTSGKLVQALTDAWGTLHNLSVDMEDGPIRHQMQRRAVAIREVLEEHRARLLLGSDLARPGCGSQTEL